MDQAAVAFVKAQRPWQVSRRGPRRFGRVAVISLWLHLTLLALLLVTVRYKHQEDMLPPPSTVSMVFEGGSPQGPALPNPKPNATPQAPEATPPVPQPPAPQAAVTPPPPPPTPQTTVSSQPPPPSPQAQTRPAPSPPPPTPPPPAATAELPLPPPPPPLAMVVPRPALPPSRPVQPPTSEPRPPAPNRSQAFPTPMNFSFNPAPPALRSPAPRSSRAPSTMDFSLAPRQGATDLSPFSMVSGATVGPDWRNALSAWVKAHAYYPEQAAMNGEDGSAMVLVQANPDGHVTSVELERKSGSQWLDLALLSLFRDAHLPPIYGEKEPIGFHFTMHYILIRQ